MGIKGLSDAKFFVDDVEVGEIKSVTVEVEKDEPEYVAVKLPDLREISLSGTFMLGRGNGKSSIVWKLIANGYKRLIAAEKKSKQIRRSSYRKTKSQRRRGIRK